ncbi:MAG: hypothetical protein ACRDO8_09515, partial [Nocardioidaceae bacterium]
EMSIRGWPALVKAAYRPPGCQRSATFTGTLDVIDPEYRPDEGDYGVALPYPAWFTATHGRALGLGDRWSSVMLEARITRDTEPVPSPQFLKRALSGETPVTLTTTCRGDRFEVATIGFADGHP